MSAITLNELWTLMVALATIQIGIAIVARVPVLAVDSIPPTVVGGVVVAAVLLVARQFGWRIEFGTQARGAPLMFFTTLGLSARLGALRGGGAAVALVALALLAVTQHRVGAGVAWATLGLMAGGVLGNVDATKLLARARRTAPRHEPALALVWATP